MDEPFCGLLFAAWCCSQVQSQVTRRLGVDSNANHTLILDDIESGAIDPRLRASSELV